LACAPLAAQETVRTYALRIDGKVAGSVIETESPATEAGRAVLRFTSKTLAKVEVLGSPIDQRVEATWLLDATTRGALRVESTMTVGESRTELKGRLVDGTFRVDGSDEPLDPAQVVIAPDYRWLLARGPKQAGTTVELDCLVPELGGVHRLAVAWADDAEREMDVLGKQTAVRGYLVDLVALRLEATVWVTRDTGELVRYEMPSQKVVIERAAAADVARPGRADMTERILVRTNLDIADPSPLTFLRVRATIDTGRDVTVASLNVPGQTFEGTAENGRVQGVFEIRTGRSDGTGSPAFPPPPGTFDAAWLQPYLAPEKDIESDDPGIVQQAKQLAEGATTCFQVVERLARWAHAEIPYVIPGGGSAKRTFDSRQGECGGHSRVLAAMLRSLGIPARTPMGGMYVPLHGGSFGQHMWNEVWLGEAIGWLPVDCTAGQPTFIDATHIRLGDGLTSFGPQVIEVLDYEPKARPAAEAAASVARRADAYPFLSGAPMVFAWSRSGRQLGDERVTYSVAPSGGHVMESSLSLAGGAFQETTRTEVGDDGRLLSFHAERTEGPQQSTFDIVMEDGKAVCTKTSIDGERTDTVAVDASLFPLHNNCSAHFLLPLSRYWPLAEGAEVKLRVFHTEHRSPLPLTLRGGGSEAITIGGTEVRARIVQVELAGITIKLHVDDQGRMLRYHQKQGDVTIELQQL
jgi:transglutaminase-like putative cysteine protease